jgi:hypothetical protein
MSSCDRMPHGTSYRNRCSVGRFVCDSNCSHRGLSCITDCSLSPFPSQRYIERRCQALVDFLAKQMQHMVRAIMRPLQQLLVLLPFERSASVFRDKPFVPHRIGALLRADLRLNSY